MGEWEKELGGEVSASKLQELRRPQLLDLLQRAHQSRSRKNSQVDSEEDDETLCPICCTSPPDAEFVPCGHTSCMACVDRHLLNSRRCFFCNAEINEVQRRSSAEH
eukprot:NODE_8258_length_418_cov_3.355014_g7390_i0.p2 GENE.NODE_8258_length_418_cov_3.355014_g7390_i0~~NODE_8258_length_418_cov_3.355014_g7390_i0.p2  ORF type:complete len:115 (+),score=40.24 NODE_8258_length_418_cov_3.355014_g7390_i0:28-345(+)